MNRPKPHNHHPLPDHAKKVFHGKLWQIHQWDQEWFDGTTKIYEAVKRQDSVIIFPIIDENVVIIEEEQPHWGRMCDSIVAGGINDEEDIFTAAQRETEEETGMLFKDFYLVHSEQRHIDIHANFYVFVAKNMISKSNVKLDGGEKTIPKEVDFDKLISMTKERKFFHKPFFIDEFIIQDKIDTLFDMFRNPDKYSIL